jgi:ABC-type glycerol-3-phosphate transport system substrate-binding protein
MKALSRRDLLRRSALTAMGVTGLTGCASAAGAARQSHQAKVRPGERISLTFWTWEPLQDAVALWNREHPDIHVTMQIIPGGSSGGYQKMYAALRSGKPPDIAHVEYQELAAFMLVQGLTNLRPFGIDKYHSRYVEWQWRQGIFGNGVYTVPWASGPMGMFYRKDLFKKWGIQPPRTWDDFAQAARTVRRKDSHAYLHSFPSSNSAWFEGLAWQAGGQWVRTDGDTWIIDIDNPQTRRVAQFWDRLIADDLVIIENDGQSAWYKQIQQGTLGSFVTADWYDALLRDNAPNTSGKWLTTRMPQWTRGARKAANWGGSSLAVLQGTQYPQQAMEFGIWLSTDVRAINLSIPQGSGWPGAEGAYSRTVLSKPDKFFSNQSYNSIFVEADANIDESWRFLPTNDSAISHMNDAFAAAIATKSPLADTLPDVQSRVIDDMKAKNLKVRGASS